MIKIPLELFTEILYFVNDWLRIMGYGGEYKKLSRLVWALSKAGAFRQIELKKYSAINQVVTNLERLEKIEGVHNERK